MILIIEIEINEQKWKDDTSSCKLNACVYITEILIRLNFQENEKFSLCSQGTYNFQNLGNKT